MAPRTQPNLAADERTERDFALDVNDAVAATEREISAFAFGDDEPENDADTSLEQMGDGLEGGDLEDDAEDEALAGDVPLEDEQRAADDAEDGDEIDDQQAMVRQADQRQPRRAERQGDERQPMRGVAPAVHREQRQRARAAEEGLETERQRADRLERDLAETRGRLDMLTQTVVARPQPQQREQPAADPKPDMFTDPDAYDAWVERRTERRAREIAQQTVGGFRQEMLQRDEQRVERSFQEVKASPAGFMLDAAYRALTSLDKNDPRARATVAAIVASPNAAQATLEWFEQNGAEDYRAQVAEELGLEPVPYEDDDQGQQRQQRRGNGYDDRRQQGGNRQQPRQQQPRQQQGQPRQVYRMPVSLNAARGGAGNGRGMRQDPDMTDDSDASAFDFAMR